MHAETIEWAVALPDGRLLRQETGTSAETVRRMLRRLRRGAPGLVQACYEAGPTGYGLQRLCESEGVACDVVAPSLIPVKSGSRVKTDRLDAAKLRELHRAGLLTAVHAPTPAEEAARSVMRRLRSAKEDSAKAQHEIKSLLLFIGNRVGAKVVSAAWTKAIDKVVLADWGHQRAFDDAQLAYRQAEERVKLLMKDVETLAKTPAFADAVNALQCLKGVALITAMEIATEALSPERFPSAPHFMAFTGLTPSENSSGMSESRGRITKMGNKRLRTPLVAAARHSSHRVKTESQALRARRKEQPEWVVELARQAERRLHARYWMLVNSGKHVNVAVTAVARELAGFVWAILRADRARARCGCGGRGGCRWRAHRRMK